MDFFRRPEIIRIILYLLEVAHRNSSGIRENIRNHGNSSSKKNRIGIRGRRTIRELEDELGLDFFCIFHGDLILECCWDQNIT